MDTQIEPTKSGFNSARFDVRLLTGSETDTAAYRALRDKIRNSDGARNFADSYTREDRLNEHSWPEWCAAKREHCIVSTFDKQKDNKLVSIMMITAQGPTESLVAELEATWVEDECRGTGVAGRAYKEVFRQAREYGYQHAVVFIRYDNYHSREIREGQDFRYLATHDVEWADKEKTVAPAHLFILDLHPDCPVGEDPHERAIRRLEQSLTSIGDEEQFKFLRESIDYEIATMWHERPALQPEYPLAALVA